MLVQGWVWAMALSLPLLGLPARGQQQDQPQQPSQAGQQSPSAKPKKSTSKQDLPSAPQPQPTAGQQSQDSQVRPAPAPKPAKSAPEPGPYGPTGPSTAAEPPRTTTPDTPDASSSKQDRIDISPPANDAKAHPNSDQNWGDSGVSEFHPFDPHRAAKDIEVGEFYFKQHNYRAAISRYREALLYKPNDAIATYNLAEALEKAGDLQEATRNYQAYLKILPYGPKAKDAQKALQRLRAKIPESGKRAESGKQ